MLSDSSLTSKHPSPLPGSQGLQAVDSSLFLVFSQLSFPGYGKGRSLLILGPGHVFLGEDVSVFSGRVFHSTSTETPTLGA
jgi:hypothetical protein